MLWSQPLTRCRTHPDALDVPGLSAPYHSEPLTSSTMNIRPIEATDRERIHRILVSITRFTDQEVNWAMELVDSGIANGSAGEYLVYVLDEPGSGIQGYVCYGPTPLTEDVYDLYWIAIDPGRHGEGLGDQLLRFVEAEVTNRNGRMLLIETRSRPSFASARKFYARHGYEEISRIKDFYRIEDDKIVFCKRLERA